MYFQNEMTNATLIVGSNLCYEFIHYKTRLPNYCGSHMVDHMYEIVPHLHPTFNEILGQSMVLAYKND